MKGMHKNQIRFNCANYHRMLMSHPANCYNCMLRDGYPQNLGGDKACRNFVPKTHAKPSTTCTNAHEA